MRRDRLRPVAYLVHGHHHGATANRETAAAHGAVTLRCVQGVAVIDADLLHWHSQAVGNDLGEAGLLSLAVSRLYYSSRRAALLQPRLVSAQRGKNKRPRPPQHGTPPRRIGQQIDG